MASVVCSARSPCSRTTTKSSAPASRHRPHCPAITSRSSRVMWRLRRREPNASGVASTNVSRMRYRSSLLKCEGEGSHRTGVAAWTRAHHQRELDYTKDDPTTSCIRSSCPVLRALTPSTTPAPSTASRSCGRRSHPPHPRRHPTVAPVPPRRAARRQGRQASRWRTALW